MSNTLKYENILTKDVLLSLYVQQGLSQSEIGRKYGTEHKRVGAYLKKYGIIPRAIVNYSIDSDFFKHHNDDMAYVLGFILSDGSITKNNKGVTFGVHHKDGYILNVIAKVMGFNGPIKTWSKKDVKYTYNTLCIFNKEIVRDLATYHIFNSKTGKEKFPDLLPPNCYWSFLRGYFDGDGSIIFDKKKKRAITFCCANKDLLQDINIKILDGVCKILTNYNKKTNKPYYILYVYKKEYIRNIYINMYSNIETGLFLTRKKEKMELAIQ